MSNQIEQKLIKSVKKGESGVSRDCGYLFVLSQLARKALEAVQELMCARCNPHSSLSWKKPVPHFGNHFSSVLKKLSVNGLFPGARCSENWDSSQAGDLLTQRCPWNCCLNHLREFWIRPPVPAGLWLQLGLQMMPWNWTSCSWELIPLKSIISDPWSCCLGDGRLASESQLSEIVPFSPLSETSFFFYYYTSW